MVMKPAVLTGDGTSLDSMVTVVKVHDNVGRIIETSKLIKNGSGTTTISLDGYGAGFYFIKCYNSTFESNFKVVKL